MPITEDYDTPAPGFDAPLPNDDSAEIYRLIKSSDPAKRAEGRARIAEHRREIEEYTRAGNPDYQKVGLGGPNPYNPENKPLDTTTGSTAATAIPPPTAEELGQEAGDASGQNPAAPIGPPTEIDIRKAAANAASPPTPRPLDQTLREPNHLFGSTREMYNDLVVDKGLDPGAAVAVIAERFKEGDPTVTGLVGIDDFMKRVPSKPSRFASQTIRSFQKTIAATGDTVVGGMNALADLVGLEPSEWKPELPKWKAQDKFQVPVSIRPGLAAGVANVAPELLGQAPIYYVAGEALAAGLAASILKLPRYAEAAAYVKGTAEKARFGQALLSPEVSNLPQVGSQLANISRASNFLGQVGSAGAISAMNQEDWQSAIKGTGELVGGAMLLGWAGRGLGAITKLYKPNNLSKITMFISQKSGIPAGVIATRMENFAQVHATLTRLNAPEHVMKIFYDGVPERDWIKGGLASFFGKYLARVGMVEEDVLKTVGLLPEKGLLGDKVQKSVYNSWWNELLFEGKTKPVSPKKYKTAFEVPNKPTEEILRVPVGNSPIGHNGAIIYPHASSKYNLRFGPPERKEVEFKNPFRVSFDSDKETWAEAIIKSLSGHRIGGGVPVLGKQALYALNKYGTRNTIEYNKMAQELALRTLGKSGYGSAFVKGKGPNAKFYIDLTGYKGGAPSEVIDKIEKELSATTDRIFRHYPSVAPWLVGAAAGTAAYLYGEGESQAVDFGGLRKLASKVAGELWDSEGASILRNKLESSGQFGTVMALDRTAELLGSRTAPETVENLINRLEGVHFATQAAPDQFITKVNMDPINRDIHVMIKHPGVPNPSRPSEPATIVDLTGTVGEDGYVRGTNLDGYGEGVLGRSALRGILRGVNKEYGIKGWDVGDKGTGAIAKATGGYRRSKATIKFGVPIAVGYGLYDPDEADAAMDVGALRKLVGIVLRKGISDEAKNIAAGQRILENIEKGILASTPENIKYEMAANKLMERGAAATPKLEQGIVNYEAITNRYEPYPTHDLSRFINRIAEKSPVTADLLGNIVRRQGALGTPVRIDGVLKDYERVLYSLKNPIEVRSERTLPLVENYEKQMVFHGTPAAFDEFRTTEADEYALFGPGIYTTTNPDIASGYAKTRFHNVSEHTRSNIRPMKIKPGLKFFDIDKPVKPEDIEKYYNVRYKGAMTDEQLKARIEYQKKDLRDGEMFYEQMVSGAPPRFTNDVTGELDDVAPRTFIRDLLKHELGYAGITHIGGGRTGNDPHRVYILFDKENLETAHGLAAKNEAPAYAYMTPATEHTNNLLWDMMEGQEPAKPGNWGTTTKTGGSTIWNPRHGYLEFEIGHELSGDVARVGGYVDPWDHTWFVNAKELADAGLSIASLGSLVEAGITAGRIKGVRTNFSKLALIAAATAAAYTLGMPQEANASPMDKLWGAGYKGIADSFNSSVMSAANREAAQLIMSKGMKEAAENLPKEFPTAAEELFAAGATNPKQVFKESWWRDLFSLGADPKETLTTAPHLFKLPAYAIEHPIWKRFHSQWIVKQEKMLTGMYSTSALLKQKVLENIGDIPIEQFDELETAVKGLVRNSKTFAYEQSLPDVAPRINKAAMFIKTQVDDELFRIHSGIDPRAPAILQELSLEETPDTWRKLRYFQSWDYAKGGLPTWKGIQATTQEIGAASRTKDMLNWRDFQDIDTAKLRGSLTRFPVQGELALLQRESDRLAKLVPNGMSAEDANLYKSIKSRLAEIDALNEKIKNRRSSNLGYLPGKHYWGPISEARALDIPIYDKNAGKVVGRYIDGALSQAFFNEQLHFGRFTSAYLAHIGQTPASEYVKTFLNVMRGLRSLDQDVYWASRMNRALRHFGAAIGVQDLRRYTDNLLKVNFVGKLALNPAYPLINLTQPLLTGAPVTGIGNLMIALPQVLTQYLAGSGNIIREAQELGILRQQSQFMDISNNAWTKAMKVADILPNHSENFNRALVYYAGKLQALDKIRKGKFNPEKIPKYLDPYFDYSVIEKGNPEDIAKAWGAAVVRSTQFVLGQEGRSLSFSGGTPRRLVGQFRSFQQGYANLLLAAIKDDPKVAAKLVSSLVLMGGVNAIAGDYVGGKIIDVVRAGVAAAGGDPNIVPEGSPIGKVFELLGIDSPIQLVGAASPISLYNLNPVGAPDKFIQNAIGPTAGTAYQMAGAIGGYASGRTDASKMFTQVVRSVAPGTLGIAGLEALHEAGYLNFADEEPFNYRGGIFGPTGKRLVEERPWYQVAARGFNLQPSVSSQRNNYKFRIMDQMANGNVDRALEILQEAQDAGFIFTRRDIGNMRSKMAGEEKYNRPNER